MPYKPNYRDYSRPPQGWHDEPFQYVWSFQSTFTSLAANPALGNLLNQPLQLDPDADFYLRGMAVVIDPAPPSVVAPGNLTFNMRLRDSFGRPLDNDFVPMQAYATNPAGFASADPQEAGNPAATPWYPELYCPASSAMWADFQAEGPGDPPPVTFVFNAKIPGSIIGGNLGQTLSAIIGPEGDVLNTVFVGDTNPAGGGLFPAYALCCGVEVSTWLGGGQLVPSDLLIGDDLEVVGWTGTWLAVTSEAHDTGAGAIWLFQCTNPSLLPTIPAFTQQQEIDGVFGVALQGTVLVAISLSANNLFIYNLVGSVWTLAQTIALPGAYTGSFLLGNQLFVGNANTILYYQLVAGTWTLIQTITAPLSGVGFGAGGIGFDGVTLVVGAPTTTGGGVVYTYVQSGGVFTLTATLTGSDTVAGDHFGYSVAVQGALIAVGAINNLTHGAAYLFESGVQSQKLVQTDATGSDDFGCKVSLYSGATSWLAVGAFGNAAGIGAAYFYSASDPIPATTYFYSFHVYFQGVKRFENESCEPSTVTGKTQPKSGAWFEGNTNG
jgi:FG-GAP repeat